HRRADAETQAAHEVEYRESFLNPWVAASRGFVDAVIEPSATRAVVAAGLASLVTKRERLRPRKHDNGPL
ncbi:MAG: carboxyl transferase domain-containing protein, partial [Acidimicrobiales bacterium]